MADIDEIAREVDESEYAEYKKTFEWNLDFRLNIGEMNKEFFDATQEKRILGRECPECGDVLVPPRPFCDKCMVETTEWVEMEQRGALESYTVCFFEFLNMPDPPYMTGVIRVDDAATCMLHLIDGIDYDDPHDLIGSVEKGTEVEPVWADERDGDIHDIAYWTPVE